MKKELKIKCSCTGNVGCPKLKVIDYEDKDCEIQLEKGRLNLAIYLGEKSIKKLIKYLETLTN